MNQEVVKQRLLSIQTMQLGPKGYLIKTYADGSEFPRVVQGAFGVTIRVPTALGWDTITYPWASIVSLLERDVTLDYVLH